MDGHSITYRTTAPQGLWDTLMGSSGLWIAAAGVLAVAALSGVVIAGIDLRHRIRRGQATPKRKHLLLSSRLALAIAAAGVSVAVVVLVIGSTVDNLSRTGDERRAQTQQIAAELQQWEQVRNAIGDLSPADLRAGHAVSFASLINPEAPRTQQCELVPANTTDRGVTVTLICDNAIIPHPSS